MTNASRLIATAVTIAAVLAGGAAGAHAAPRQLALIQDDAAFVEGTRGDPAALLREARHELGADIVRANLYWRAVSPAVHARRKPAGFDVGDPSSPGYSWAMYDRFVANARAAGLRVYITISGPFPDWASRQPRRCRRDSCIWKPSSRLFGQFAKAVARRYRGRVRYWSIWNEPNHNGWLRPQYTHRRRVRYSARMYRSLWYRGYRAIRRYDPARRRSVLFGEFAPFASPRAFFHASMCLTARGGRPLHSRARGCPRRPRKLPVGAIAHHPYPHGATAHPLSRVRGRSNITIAYLPRLKRSMALAARYRRMPRARSIYLTEYGIQSRPPDRYAPSLRGQAKWLNESARLVWRDDTARAALCHRVRQGSVQHRAAPCRRCAQAGLGRLPAVAGGKPPQPPQRRDLGLAQAGQRAQGGRDPRQAPGPPPLSGGAQGAHELARDVPHRPSRPVGAATRVPAAPPCGERRHLAQPPGNRRPAAALPLTEAPAGLRRPEPGPPGRPCRPSRRPAGARPGAACHGPSRGWRRALPREWRGPSPRRRGTG